MTVIVPLGRRWPGPAPGGLVQGLVEAELALLEFEQRRVSRHVEADRVVPDEGPGHLFVDLGLNGAGREFQRDPLDALGRLVAGSGKRQRVGTLARLLLVVGRLDRLGDAVRFLLASAVHRGLRLDFGVLLDRDLAAHRNTVNVAVIEVRAFLRVIGDLHLELVGEVTFEGDEPARVVVVRAVELGLLLVGLRTRFVGLGVVGIGLGNVVDALGVARVCGGLAEPVEGAEQVGQRLVEDLGVVGVGRLVRQRDLACGHVVEQRKDRLNALVDDLAEAHRVRLPRPGLLELERHARRHRDFAGVVTEERAGEVVGLIVHLDRARLAVTSPATSRQRCCGERGQQADDR